MRRSVSVLSCLVILAVTPAFAKDRDVSELFDPAVLARSICSHDDTSQTGSGFEQLAALPGPKVGGKRPPLYPGLGDLSFKISTTKPEAQAYFNQGLRLTYGFNHDEAVRSFRAAEEIDPTCAICYWGESLNLGPNINGPMDAHDNGAAFKAMTQAVRLSTPVTPAKERALIEALATRYVAHPPHKRDKLDVAYADAMKKAYQAFPNDPDITISFIEAAMVASPFPWFVKGTNAPTGRVGEAIAATEKLLAADPHHPGAIHYYIHLAEQPMPEKAEPYADQLGDLMPGAGHMVHMPSHIFFRLGRYEASLHANVLAVDADEKLIETDPDASLRYRYGLFLHNIHMAMASASMAGDAKEALAMEAKLLASLSPDKTRGDYYFAATFAPVLRFEDPAVTLARPQPDAKMPVSVGLWHYARGSAFAWRKDLASARAEADAVAKVGAKLKHDKKGPGTIAVMELAEEVLRARIALADGNMAETKTRLESAVAIEERETLYRGDPPAWDVPLRQSLGVFLMRTGHPADAVPLLRQALLDTPNNAWVLYALKEASTQMGDTGAAEEYGKLFAKAWLGKEPPDLSRI